MAGEIAFFEGGSRVLEEMERDLARARGERRSFRVETGQTINVSTGEARNWVKWKVGEDMWSPPFHEDADPYRDRP